MRSSEITDDDFRIGADSVALQRIPLLVDSWSTDDGEVYTLGNRVVEVDLLVALLKTAIRHDRDVCID